MKVIRKIRPHKLKAVYEYLTTDKKYDFFVTMWKKSYYQPKETEWL